MSDSTMSAVQIPTTPPVAPPTALMPEVAGAVSSISTDQTAAPPPAPPAPPAPATSLRDANGQEVTSDKLKERIDRAKEQERAALLAKLGFKTIEEAEASAKAQAERAAKEEEVRRSTLSREQQLSEELDRERKQRITLEEKERKAREELEYSRRMGEIQTAALSSGVRSEEVDYAMFEFGRYISSLSEDSVATADPAQYFATVLKAKKPHLFGGQPTQATPATTGLPGGDGAAPPPPRTAPTEQVDAFKMDKAAWFAHLRKLGHGV